MSDTMLRLYFPSASLVDVENLLDSKKIKFDWDGGNRLLIKATEFNAVSSALDSEGIDYDVI